MRYIEGNTFAELYEKIVDNLVDDPEYITSPRGQKIKEITNAVFQLNDPTQNLFKNNARSVPMRYLAGELLWYFSGRNDIEFITRFSNFWKHISDNGKANSAYGKLLFNTKDTPENMSQWEWAYSSLVKDSDSRQAILHFNRPLHQYNGVKDFVCTLVGVFQIRDNKLNFTIDMRSNDIFFGLTFDLPFFTTLQQQMLRHLTPHYPDLELGTYTQVAHSLHLYERDFEKIENMRNNIYESAALTELDADLVFNDGRPTESLINCIAAVENNHQFNSESKFIKWLYDNSTREV